LPILNPGAPTGGGIPAGSAGTGTGASAGPTQGAAESNPPAASAA
jgi:hypothetical protein